MPILIFEGDYVQVMGTNTYHRVISVSGNTLLLANGVEIQADLCSVKNYMSEREYWEYSEYDQYNPGGEV